MAYRERYSFSRLDTYQSCLRKYKLRYIDRIRSGDNQWSSIGTAAHDVAETLVNESIKSGKPLDRSRIPDLLRHAWVKAGGQGDNEDFSQALDWLRTWVDSERDLNISSVVGTEIDFRINMGDFDVQGKIDRIDRLPTGRLLVIDYKTNRMLYEKWKLEKSLQASIYTLAAQEIYEEEEVPLSAFTMLAHGSVRQYTQRTKEQLEAVVYYIKATVGVIRTTKNWKPKLGPFCFWCEHNGSCDAYGKAMTGDESVRASIDPKAAARLLSQAKAVEKASGQTKRAAEAVIKAWVNKTGETLRVNGVNYGIINVETQAFDVRDVISALAKSAPEIDPIDIAAAVCSVKKSSLERFIEDLPIPRSRSLVLEERIKAAATTKISPRLSNKG
jgi:RecB family exonuclease